jgi:fumarate hydratase, class II
MTDETYRTERDSLGEIRVPTEAYWGAQTQRALENFTVSGWRMPREIIHALARIKRFAAEVNGELGLLDPGLSRAVGQAAAEVAAGRFDDQFPLDVFQTGSGTSTNMNVNEVIANRANEILGGRRGARSPVHPNDHVNRGQSSNDVFPTALHLAVRERAAGLLAACELLQQALEEKAGAFAGLIKIGRTHLQDAVPMTLGQEFSGFAAHIEHGRERIVQTWPHLEELALGATAVGTGLNAHPKFAAGVIERLAAEAAVPYRPAPNRFEALAGRDALVAYLGVLNTLAVSLMRIANDLRLLASGPRGGLGEISLPTLQPGSSIMPGKVNPVIPEMVIQVAAHVMGSHLAVTVGGQHGPLELNMMMPLIGLHAVEATRLLREAVVLLAGKCVAGIEARRERCEELVQWSLALVTPLALEIGYDRAAAIAHRAYREGRTVRDVALEEKVVAEQRLDEILDPRNMLGSQDVS